MKIKNLLIALGLLLVSNTLYAQSDLRIFGFSQTQFEIWRGNTTVTAPTFVATGVPEFNPDGSLVTAELPINIDRNGFMMSQTNIILQKGLDENTSVFINTEYVRNADTEQSFGGIKLREAWINYYMNDFFQIRAGTMLPRFNRLSEIRNRVALFNYNYRPVIYEESFRNIADGSTFVPDFANFMIHGTWSLNSTSELNYAAFLGNADFDFSSTSSDTRSLTESGVDTTDYLMVGGRIGYNLSTLDYGDLSIGVSSTYDNHSYYTSSGLGFQNPITGQQLAEVGAVPRLRVGYDVSYALGSWSIESEGSIVNMYPSDAQKALQAQIAQIPFPVTDRNTNNYATYHYGAISKSFENLFLTAKIEHLNVAYSQYNEDPILIQGYTIGYRFNNSIVTRFETLLIDAEGSDVFALKNNFYSIAIGFTF